jgi:hypothetical protein
MFEWRLCWRSCFAVHLRDAHDPLGQHHALLRSCQESHMKQASCCHLGHMCPVHLGMAVPGRCPFHSPVRKEGDLR